MTTSEINDLNLNEVVSKWSAEVAELSAQFEESAALVARWDRQILHNGDRVRALHRDSESLQVCYKELTENLDTVTAQQNELHAMLERLERDVEAKLGARPPSTSRSTAVRADLEREKMHGMATACMADLDAMALSIRDLVVELNKKNGSEDSAADAVSQIVSVLNSHLDSLQYLDDNAAQLARRVTEVAQQCEAYARDGAYERSNANGVY